MEVIVSVTLFAVIILSASEVFKLTIDAQRSGLASQNVEESLKYFLEVTAKEVRMAQKNEGVCSGIPDEEIFATSTNALGDTLAFKNYLNQCVTYSLETDTASPFGQRFKIVRDGSYGFISPAAINLDTLHFLVATGTSTQTTVMVNSRAHALNQGKSDSEMTIQTTLTSRYYK